jgi:hypothetical protein
MVTFSVLFLNAIVLNTCSVLDGCFFFIVSKCHCLEYS